MKRPTPESVSVTPAIRKPRIATAAAATCTAKAVCTVCGGEYGEMAAHSFTAEKAETQYLKSAATCTEKAVYYKSCAVCGLSSEGTADEATFFSGNALDHDWGAWTQNSDERPTPESVSVTPAIRKPRIATAARRPVRKRPFARTATQPMARWRHTASLPKKQRRSI
ncbi:MAG: hypothetical protein ACLSHR_00055 [Oscillospiraceae bacterium]